MKALSKMLPMLVMALVVFGSHGVAAQVGVPQKASQNTQQNPAEDILQKAQAKALRKSQAQAELQARAQLCQVLYDQALEALQGKRFVIQAKEFFFPNGKTTRRQNSSDSYISLNGSQATMRFSPNLFPSTPVHYLHTQDEQATITKAKIKNNADAEFVLEIGSEYYWGSRKFLITLYGQSNQCWIRAAGGPLKTNNLFEFRGEILPLEES